MKKLLFSILVVIVIFAAVAAWTGDLSPESAEAVNDVGGTAINILKCTSDTGDFPLCVEHYMSTP